MNSGLPPYLAQQNGINNDFMGGQYSYGYMNAPSAYMTGATMYGPTYGQFDPMAQALMPTPYGGGINVPSVAAYRSTMVDHPFKAFLTYSIPIYKAPKGLTPLYYNNYLNEARTEGIMSVENFGISTAIGVAGGFLGGPVGAIAGALLGYGFSKLTGNAMGRIMQIHEIGNLLHMKNGQNAYGIGMSMSQASDLYHMFAKSAASNANFTEEEYQLSFSQLARNQMIDDTGTFSAAKENIKKMKHIIVGLQDLFQNGDIKTIVASLRQFRNLGIYTDDLATVSIKSSIAAGVLGQKPTDYITNAIGEAQSTSAMTNFSSAGMLNVANTIYGGVDAIKKVKDYYRKGLSSVDVANSFKQTLIGSLSETANPEIQAQLLSQGIFSAQAYTVSALEAGIVKYNKENKTHLTLEKVLNNPNLVKEISTKYALPAMKDLETKYHGDALKIYQYLSAKDVSYLATMNNPLAMKQSLTNVNNVSDFLSNWGESISKNKKKIDFLAEIEPGLFRQTEKMTAILSKNPHLFQKINKETNFKTKEAAYQEQVVQSLRDNSVAGMIQKMKARIQEEAASLMEKLIPNKYGMTTLKDINNKDLNSAVDLIKQTKIYNPDNVVTKAEFKDSSFLHGLDNYFHSDEKVKTNVELLSDVIGDSTWSISKDEVERDWAYRRGAAQAFESYNRGLDYFFRNPYSQEGEHFEKEYSKYFEKLANPEMEKILGKIIDGKDYTTLDTQGIEIFKELINSTKELARRIQELSQKKHLTVAEEKELIADKHTLEINKNSMKMLYGADNYGMTDLFKLTGEKITAPSMSEFGAQLLFMKKDKKVWGQLVKGYMKLEGVNKEVAEHNLNLFAEKSSWSNYKNRFYKEAAVKSSKLISDSMITPESLNGGIGNFISSGGVSEILKTFKKVGDINKVIEGLDALYKAKKTETYSIGYNDKNIQTLLVAANSNLSSKDLKADTALFNQLKKNWSMYTGGEDILVNGKKISDFSDFMELSDANKKTFFSKLASTQIMLTAAARLGVSTQELGSKKGEGYLRDLFDNIVTYKDGKFVLRKGIDEILKNKKDKEALEFFGVGANQFGIHKIVQELNDKASSKLDETNKILNKIYSVLKKKETGKAKFIGL